MHGFDSAPEARPRFEAYGGPPRELADQADGLRRLFGAQRPRFVAVVANAEMAFSGLVLERLAGACSAAGRRTLVVDAAANSPAPHELVALDLAAGIDAIAPGLDYLAARGLPLRYVNSRGSCAGFLQAVADAAPACDVVIVHAEASDVGRLFTGRAVRPLLLAADHPATVTQAYAGLKLLAQRHSLMAFGLLLAALPHEPRVPRIAEQLALTADRFVGAALHDWACIDPTDAHVPRGLARLVHGLLHLESAYEHESAGSF
ncbi:MAG: flagellar biosynthesis protein [Pseudomonadota bacterium]